LERGLGCFKCQFACPFSGFAWRLTAQGVGAFPLAFSDAHQTQVLQAEEKQLVLAERHELGGPRRTNLIGRGAAHVERVDRRKGSRPDLAAPEAIQVDALLSQLTEDGLPILVELLSR